LKRFLFVSVKLASIDAKLTTIVTLYNVKLASRESWYVLLVLVLHQISMRSYHATWKIYICFLLVFFQYSSLS
jgi:hypothetical protein